MCKCIVYDSIIQQNRQCGRSDKGPLCYIHKHPGSCKYGLIDETPDPSHHTHYPNH